MRINILEDNWNYQAKIEQVIRNIVVDNNLHLSYLEFYSSSDKLLDAVSLYGIGQVYFLKIGLKGNDTKGLTLARQIRKLDPFAHIIFLTNQMQHLAKVFEMHIQALDYIDKNLDDKRLEERLTNLFLELKDISNYNFNDVFTYANHRNHFQLPYHKILYFETSTKPHHVNLVSKTQTIEFEANLIDIVGKSPKLYRCHRSFIINIDNIRKIYWGKRLVEFENGDTCMISRSKLEGLIELTRVQK